MVCGVTKPQGNRGCIGTNRQALLSSPSATRRYKPPFTRTPCPCAPRIVLTLLQKFEWKRYLLQRDPMKQPLKFDLVLRLLTEQRTCVVEKLRVTRTDPELIEAKRQLDRSIQCLSFCEKHQISLDEEPLTLPPPRDAFGEFLVVDVDEERSASSWVPLVFNEETVVLGSGDMVIRRRGRD